MSVASLLLADSRFPAGGHAYSGGVEPAVTAGMVTDLASLEAFLRGRLETAGLVAAGVAAAACAHAVASGPPPGTPGEAAERAGHGAAPGSSAGGLGEAAGGRVEHESVRWGFWDLLDAETDARTPAPAQRDASRRQGRALLRAGRVAWPEAGWPPQRAPHHAVVLGAAVAAAGGTPAEAARVAAYQAAAGPVSAAVRLLALDPMRANGVLAGLARQIDEVAERAAACAHGPLADLPCPSAPALDLLSEAHMRAEVRLFES